MTEQEFRKRFSRSKAELQQYLINKSGTILGSTALSWFNHYYRQEVWFNGSGWQRWKKPKRYDPKGPASARYGTLMSKRDHLFRSTGQRSGVMSAVIYNRVPYAEAHNQGAEFDQTIPITKKMRKWAWAMYYANGGGQQKKGSMKGKGAKAQMQILMSGAVSNPVADKYKALALTKKQVIRRHVSIPKRPFIYANAELARVLRERIKGDIKHIMGFK